MRQIMLMATFFRFYEYDDLLNWKFQLVDVMNGILSKENKDLNWKNIHTTSLLSVLFSEQDDIVVDESYAVIKQIGDVIYSSDFREKWTLFNVVRKKVSLRFADKSNVFYQFIQFINFGFDDFFKDLNITNNIIKDKADKILLMHTFLNVYKILLAFPSHVKSNTSAEGIAAIKTKMTGRILANKELDYLKGDFDNDRLSDYTSTDNIKVYIASIDSYYFLYKKYGIEDKSLYMIFEVYDYIEKLTKNPKHPEHIKNYLNELLHTLGMICSKSFNIDINNLF